MSRERRPRGCQVAAEFETYRRATDLLSTPQSSEADASPTLFRDWSAPDLLLGVRFAIAFARASALADVRRWR
jgi:hypothetical protein